MSSNKVPDEVNTKKPVPPTEPETSAGDFKNDPPDADNPNEAIEQFNEKLRPKPL